MLDITMGNNVIIGAGAIVTREFPNDVIVAGVPARVIKSYDEYYEKGKKDYIYL